MSERAVPVGSGVAAAALAAAGAVASVTVAAGAVAAAMARRILTPPTEREQDIRVLGAGDATVTLSRTPDSQLPGRYSLFTDDDTGHARLGDIVAADAGSVTREVLRVDRGDLAGARAARISGWFYLSPKDLGVAFEQVEVPTTAGPASAWLIPAAEDTGRWVIQVHGRAVTRQETLRAVPVFREAGFSSLLISYRNDADAPRSGDGRYALGDAEWRDVDAAMRFAVDRGARELVLMGWSMGGAIVLQAVTRSPLAAAVRGVVLDSPVIDWVDVLDFQGRLARVPPIIRRVAIRMMREPWAGWFTGLSEPIDFARLDFVRRAGQLHVPVLLMHSVDDGYVPVGPSEALAAARPDIVTFERFEVARHVKLWNFDPARWNGAIRNWIEALPRVGR